jgi:protein disulfide-isomerase A1
MVVDFNHDNAQKAFRGWVDSHLLIFASRKNHSWNEIVQKGTKLARKEEFFTKLMFLMVDLDEDDHRRVIEYLGLKNETFPLVRIVQMKSDIEKYKPLDGVHDNLFEDDLNEAEVFKFGKDYLDRKVPRQYLSEKLPKDWNDYPVKMLTGDNFEEVLKDKSKNILVDYYAPWCGHCKALHPVWDELAETLKDQKDVLMAKMDATLNELSHTIIRSFPTIRLYKKDRKEPFSEHVEYNGERTLEGIKKFLDTDGVYGLAAPDKDEL